VYSAFIIEVFFQIDIGDIVPSAFVRRQSAISSVRVGADAAVAVQPLPPLSSVVEDTATTLRHR
jgi:hypothetical protein